MASKTLQGKYAEKLQQRIDKAIEYIKNMEDFGKDEYDDLLEILEGKNDRE